MERESLSPDSEFNYILERYFHRSRSRSGSISYPVLDRTNWIAIRGYCSELCDYDLDIWILILEEATNTRDSSTGSDSRNKYLMFRKLIFCGLNDNEEKEEELLIVVRRMKALEVDLQSEGSSKCFWIKQPPGVIIIISLLLFLLLRLIRLIDEQKEEAALLMSASFLCFLLSSFT
ncbi:hypothetical protein Tco_0778125 [Tanacetum coccineum]